MKNQLYNHNHYNKTDFWVLLLLFIFLFKPSPTQILGPEIGMKIPDVIYITMFTIFFIRYNLTFKKRKTLFLLLLLFIIEVISLFKGSMVNDLVISDVLEVTRPVLFILAFTFGTLLASNGFSLKNKKTVFLLFTIYFLFSLAIFIDINGFKDLASQFYELGKSRGHSDYNTSNIWRLSSSFTNPNYFGLSCSIFASFLFYRTINKFSIIDFFSLIMFIIFVLLSGSRTALVSLVVVFGLVIIFDLAIYRIKSKRKLFIYLVLFIGVFGILVPKMIAVASEILWRFTNTANMEASFQARVNEWVIALNSIENNILIGVGSNKSEVKSLDNNYLMILYKNGISGLLVIISLLISSIVISFKLLKSSSGTTLEALSKNVSILLLCSTSVFIIAMYTSVPLYMSQLSIPYFILFGYVNEIGKAAKYA